MTKTEKAIIVCLVLFLLIGIVVRAAIRYQSKAGFKVIPTEKIVAEAGQFQNLDLSKKPLDLNSAVTGDFEKLDGIGPKLSKAIIEYRNQKGSFLFPEEILEVKGFGKERYENLRKYLMVDGEIGSPVSTLVAQVPINETANQKYLNKIHKKPAYPRSAIPKNPINVNTAGVEELASLPYVGKKLAEKIVQYRNTNGIFEEKNELLKIEGITISLYKKIELYLTIK